MKIVVDTSVLIAVIANESEKPALVKATRGAELIAPHSVHWEIGNAFSAMFKRQIITLEQAQQSLKIYRKIRIDFLDVELEESLKIAHQLGIYAYDAYLIRCALKYNAPLISLDRGLVGYAKQMNVNVMEVIV
jgi:predicted nucleic acid-binding protein